MNAQKYKRTIEEFNITKLGFDTHARVLNITKEEAKRCWNEVTSFEFKRFPRTEYTMRYLPELSTKWRPYWRLETPEKYLMFYLTPTTPIVIPDGFITDKGSIPLFFRNIIAHDDREMILAYLVHDLECEMKRITRFNTDGLLYEVGTELGANWLKKNIIYSAVRAAAWHKVPDRVKNGFNISKYNRELIAKAEAHFVSEYQPQHVNFIRTLGV